MKISAYSTLIVLCLLVACNRQSSTNSSIGSGSYEAAAAEVPVSTDGNTITLKSDGWHPANLAVKAGERISLTVKDETDSAADFVSPGLSIDKFVASRSQIIINVEPTKTGVYRFDNDSDGVSKGVITAR